MKGRLILIVLAGLTVGALLAWILVNGASIVKPVEVVAPEAELQPTPTPAPPQRITLFFAGNDGLLHPEIRTVPLPEEPAARIRVVVNELLAGPRTSLHPVFPYPAELHTIFVTERDQAFIDFTGPHEPLEGSATELMLVYGVVHSVLLNTEIKAVQLVFDGSERSTLTGHLDLSRPLVLNKDFVANR